MVVHINCPPVFQELAGGQNETPSPVTNRTKEGVSSTNFTSERRRADSIARTQVHAAAGCRPCTAGLPSSAAQLPVDAALDAHGLTLLILLLYAFFRSVSITGCNRFTKTKPLNLSHMSKAFLFRPKRDKMGLLLKGTFLSRKGFSR